MNETRIMSIDYGEKRIGIALCDPTKIFAYSFATIKNDNNYFSELCSLISEKNVVKIIVGLPSSKFKSSKSLAEKVKKLKSELEIKIKVEVVLWDEEYTSVIAKEKIVESVPKKSKRKNKGIIDSYSAAIILQEYLDSSQNA